MSIEGQKPTRIVIIYNPKAGQRRRALFKGVLDELARRKVDVTLRPTTKRGDGEEFARAIADQETPEFDVIVAAGGDGTIGEVVNGMIGTPLPLGVIPLGTANVLAAEIGLALKPAVIVRTLLEGRVQPSYAGVVNGRHFVAMTGAGFDARVVEKVSLGLKKWIGKGAYVLTSICELFGDMSKSITVEVLGKTYDVGSVIVAKGARYGGHFICAPNARLEDPSFQVCLFKGKGAWATVRYAVALARENIATLQDVEIIEATEVKISAPAGISLQGDGDIIAHCPAEISVEQRVLNLLVP